MRRLRNIYLTQPQLAMFKYAAARGARTLLQGPLPFERRGLALTGCLIKAFAAGGGFAQR
jgi:hypothetical protein